MNKFISELDMQCSEDYNKKQNGLKMLYKEKKMTYNINTWYIIRKEIAKHSAMFPNTLLEYIKQYSKYAALMSYMRNSHKKEIMINGWSYRETVTFYCIYMPDVFIRKDGSKNSIFFSKCSP